MNLFESLFEGALWRSRYVILAAVIASMAAGFAIFYIATVDVWYMLIFSLGLYELFISDIDEAHGSKASSKILVIESLDDLKARLAKVILMILIVTLFEHALKMDMKTPLDLLYLGGSIALIGLALYLTHAAEGHDSKETSDKPQHGHD